MAKLRVGVIEAKKLVVDQFFIGNMDVAKKLDELFDKVEAQQKQIDSLKKTIEEIKNHQLY